MMKYGQSFKNTYYPGTTDNIIEKKSLWYNEKNSRVELELSETLGYEEFPIFAEAICAMLHAEITKKIDGPDCRIWKLTTNVGAELLVIYDDLPNMGLITSENGSYDEIIIDLFENLPGEKKFDYRK